MTEHYVYLFHTKEFVDSKEPVYKIGKSTQSNFKRFNQYNEGTLFHFQMSCHNCHDLEKKIIALFKINYVLHCGREYFKGNYHCMVQDICRIIIDEKEEEKIEEVAQYWFEVVKEDDDNVGRPRRRCASTTEDTIRTNPYSSFLL
jgi:Meiotically up-regulated gene 113